MTECINETGRRLRKLRLAKGLAQKEVAERLGINEKSYTVWEVGRRKKSHKEGEATRPEKEAVDISNAHLCALADLYGVSVDYILGRTDYKTINGADVARITGLSDPAIKVLQNYKKPEDSVIDIINAVIEDYEKNGGSSLLSYIYTYVFSYPGILVSDSEMGQSLPSFVPNADIINDLAYSFRCSSKALNHIRNAQTDNFSAD